VRCTALGIEECTYESVKKKSSGGALRMGEACTSCRFVYTFGAFSDHTNPFSFPHWFILGRRKKRVSYHHHSTTRSTIPCVLKLPRNAMPSVRAQHVSSRAGNPVVFTTSCGFLITPSDRFPTPLMRSHFRTKMHLGPRALDHIRSGCLEGRRKERSLLETWDHKSTISPGLGLMDPFSRRRPIRSGIPGRSSLEKPNRMMFHQDRDTVSHLLQTRDYLSSHLFDCPSFPVPSTRPCHFFLREISRLLERHRETSKCRCMLPLSCFASTD
jgi:hypothetical protein